MTPIVNLKFHVRRAVFRIQYTGKALSISLLITGTFFFAIVFDICLAFFFCDHRAGISPVVAGET